VKTSIAFCAGFLIYGAAGIAPAAAQLVPIDPRALDPGIPPYQVMTIVRSTGLNPVSRPIRRGPNYVVIATDRSGGQVRVLVDAHYGDIRRIHPVMAPYPNAPYPNAWAAAPYGRPPGLVPLPGQGYGPEAHIHPLPPDDGYDLPPPAPNAGFEVGPGPIPPRSIPNSRSVNVPPPSLAAAPSAPHPVRTPLPRSRPEVASTQTPGPTSALPTPSAPAVIVSTPSAASASKPAAAAKPELKLEPVAPLE
jgi:hypothetical protein